MSTISHPSSTSHADLGSGRWHLDPTRSSVEFHVPHLWGLITVKGRFEDCTGTLDLSAEPAVQLTIAAASLDTGNRRRDAHLRSPDFFDVQHHPEVRFVSNATSLHGNTLTVHGQLHARGAKVPLDLDATIRLIDGAYEIEASAQVAHRDLGIVWNQLNMMRPISTLTVRSRLAQEG